jgi:hypothetical protein
MQPRDSKHGKRKKERTMSKWTGMSEWAAMSKKGRGEGVLFHHTGATGWGRKRNLGDYKGNKREGDFSHLHAKFWGEGDDAV